MANIHIYDAEQSDIETYSTAFSSSQTSISIHHEEISEANLSSDAEIISIFVSSTVTRALIEKMPNLKLIACRSAGYNNVDMLAAKERNIRVVVVPSYGEHTVAEYAFSLLLSVSRRIPESLNSSHTGTCLEPSVVRGIDLHGKTLGVVGTGKIGKSVISIAKGFGMNVLAYDMHADTAIADSLNFTYTDMDTLLAQSDVITLHAPSTPDTYHLLNDEAFEKMKDGVIIINTARGELIDTKALLVAIETEKVRGAGLDVIEGEELLKEKCKITDVHTLEPARMLEESFYINSLLAHPRVILTPHIAYNTKEAVERINQTTIENIQIFMSGSIQNEVVATSAHMGTLALCRHTQSEWNEKGIWTGTRDARLTLKGFEDARLMGNVIRDITFEHAYASLQIRTMETLSSMLGTMQQPTIQISRHKALNERDYGDYTGKNKHEMKELLGEEQFEKIRRGFDVAIPNGETLKMVYERIVPFYLSHIVPRLARGENVLIVSHGNALRALMKYIESISDTDIENVEMMFGGAVVYRLDEQGKMKHKEVRETTSMSLDTHV